MKLKVYVQQNKFTSISGRADDNKPGNTERPRAPRKRVVHDLRNRNVFEFYVTVESGDVTRSYLLALVPAAVEAVLEARVSSVRRKHEEEDCDWISDALHELKENSKHAQNVEQVFCIHRGTREHCATVSPCLWMFLV